MSSTVERGNVNLVQADDSNKDKSKKILTIISTTSVVTRIVLIQFDKLVVRVE